MDEISARISLDHSAYTRLKIAPCHCQRIFRNSAVVNDIYLSGLSYDNDWTFLLPKENCSGGPKFGLQRLLLQGNNREEPLEARL